MLKSLLALLGLSFASSSVLAQSDIENFCKRLDRKLSSVGYQECVGTGLSAHEALSVNETHIFFRDFTPNGKPLGKVLLIGGIHGDEYSSVSVVFKWIRMLQSGSGSDYEWRVIPVLNPDGLLRPPNESQRVNANGVDLNRNFPTPNWETDAKEYWQKRTYYNRRRYPGTGPASEPETAFVVAQLEEFRPDAVISVHAPHGVVDYDGPKNPPARLGPLDLLQMGTYPGSMGRYVGVHKGIPMLTVELKSALSMPDKKDIHGILDDTVGWLDKNLKIDEATSPSSDEVVTP